jgi:hypothetical protein
MLSNDTLFHSKQTQSITPNMQQKFTISPITNILHLPSITIDSTHQQRLTNHHKPNHSSIILNETSTSMIESTISETSNTIINDSLSNNFNGKRFLNFATTI